VLRKRSDTVNDTAIFDALTVYIDGKPHLAAKAVKAELERVQTEVARLRGIEDKALAQSEYIQTHGLTEYEQARLQAEVARLRAALERVSQIYPIPYVKQICTDALGVPS
jgi:hypothetical protein